MTETGSPVNPPQHIAIIMDGNGRWARQRGKPRAAGHRAGAERVRDITIECAALGVRQLTLYAFSVENWRRPRSEVAALMHLLALYLRRENPTFMKNGIRFRAIGRIGDLPASARREISRSEQLTARNPGLTLCLALSYGGRAEIVDAARSLAQLASEKRIRPEDIDEPAFARHLYTADMPDPDLLIRTAGEMRLSNFLLWQTSYTELYVTDTLWPDFTPAELRKAIEEYARRERKFGDVRPAAEGRTP